jgi:hypothetical protein
VAAHQPVRWADVAFDSDAPTTRFRLEMEALFRTEKARAAPAGQAV